MSTIIYNTINHKGHIELNGVVGIQLLFNCAGTEVAQMSFFSNDDEKKDLTNIFDIHTSFNQNVSFCVVGASVNTITHHGQKKQVLTLHISIDPNKPTEKVEQELLEIVKGFSTLKIEQI